MLICTWSRPACRKAARRVCVSRYADVINEVYSPSSCAVRTSSSRSERSVGSPPDNPSCSTPRPLASRNTRHHSSVESSRLKRGPARSEEHTSELQSLAYLVCRLLLEKKKKIT